MTTKNLTLLGAGVLIGLIFSAVILLISAPQKGKSVELLPTQPPADLTIHVSGSVVHPGLYQVPPGSRVAEAINLAGGLTPDAASDRINLAARVQDGQKIIVPSVNDPLVHNQSGDPTPLEGLVDINTADADELTQLPGIGPTRAADILRYRQNNGPFDTIEDIQKVPGIGPVMFENIKDWITVSEVP